MHICTCVARSPNKAAQGLHQGELASRPTRKRRDRRNHNSGNREAGAPLRVQVADRTCPRQMSRRELAAAVKIAHGTLRPELLPHGRAPGAANIAKLRRWLERQKAADDPRAPLAEAATPASGGGNDSRKRNGSLSHCRWPTAASPSSSPWPDYRKMMMMRPARRSPLMTR